MADAFADLSGYCRIVDDIVIYDNGIVQHANHVRAFLQRCTDMDITLNMDKCISCQTEVTFAGFRLSAEGYQVDSSTTDAIHNFPTPVNHSDLHSFFGLVNQLPTCNQPELCRKY